MNKETLWRHLLSRNPEMETGGAMTPQGYRKFFDLVWREAQKELVKDSDRDIPEFLKGLFR